MADFTDIQVCLEDKYINDVFYSGVYRGRACMVKCSSKCPWSIGNEFELSRRIYAAAPEVVAEPLAQGTDFAAVAKVAPRGKGKPLAWVATAKLAGPSLSELLARGISDAEADSFAADILRLARALKGTGIVHRDLFADNLLLDADGHLKAIDWQLAIDRHDYREDPWVARNWKFRYVVFGVNRELGLGVWNDFHALDKLLAKFPSTAAVQSARRELAADMESMAFAAPPGRLDRLRLWLYGCSLRLQMWMRGRGHRKYRQLERRWLTIRGKWRDEV